MSEDLRETETRALKAQKVGDFGAAIDLWRAIIEIQPNWEHGYAHYYLADCYTRIGEFDKAEQEYKAAIQLEPQNEMFSTALQSIIDARRSGIL
jgi:tetratricopeptide (TPR) repeat protein